MQLSFLGAAHEVTGSCSYLEVNGRHLLIDYGMEQGKDFFVNQPIPLPLREIDAVLLTHAHLDHSGLLPTLVKHGYKGPVYATEPTCHLCGIMLRDSAHIQEFEAEWRNRKALRSGQPPYEPPYTMEHAQALIRQLVPHDYNQRIPILDGVDIRYTDAGHLLGSASIELWLKESGAATKLVFSGDLGNINQPLLQDPTYIDEADYVVIESTYGDRLHDAPSDYPRVFAEIIQRSFDRGGDVIVPSFAVGRMQELLYFLRQIKERGLVRGHGDFTVYVDSPLANAATRIFTQNALFCFDAEARALLDAGINPLSVSNLITTETAEESKRINADKHRKIILSASGMCEGGRILHHLKHHLWDPKCTVLFAGYQADGTLGRTLLGGAKTVTLFGEKIQVLAEVLQLPGISGHADADKLIDWITHFTPKPRHVFVNHGENAVCDGFAARLQREYGFTASAPFSGSVFDLIQNAYYELTQPVRVKKTEKAATAASGASPAYAELLAALSRLTELVSKSPGRSNREATTLASTIRALTDDWERA